MLRADKRPGFDWLFYRYNKGYLISRHFRGFAAAGELAPASAGQRPLLYIMNHSSWWDGLLAYHAARTLTRGDHYFMMEEAQLRRYRFFRKLGAFSVSPGDPASAAVSLRYTVRLLRGGGSVWMYPQGEIVPLEQRPIRLKPGAAGLLRLCPEAAVVPVTLYHGLFRHSKPEATLLAGPPLLDDWSGMERSEIGNRLAAALTAQLEEHRERAIAGDGRLPPGCVPLVRGRKSVQEHFDGVFGRGRT
ncbi:hypothetical protein F4V43_16700 [Paenibacillus spiritus]|uniref:Phospholipid/glycerol acyltransferase domain-containing protein n=1 Tax=Paenibacillus spiritus TaxID=2496557 RepID=A0A5J5FWR5_9BACL|nr:lysophospholipid acyltransferase family protein [Paenibacillus spiritus]KAA8998388.1 hypothetical protein F4V43_16700 [Paenibacillus spiritus]